MKTNTNHARKALLALFAMLMPLLTSAKPTKINGIWYNLVSKVKIAEVAGVLDYGSGLEYKGDIVIPETIKYDGVEYTVTTIKDGAFSCSPNLTSLTIPHTIEKIELKTFHFCQSGSLSYIKVDEKNPIYDSRNNCNAIIETSTNTLLVGSINTTIPEGITSVKDNAFNGREELRVISFPKSMESIGKSAFYNCLKLRSVIISENITSIGESAFSCCDNMSTIKVETGNTTYDSRNDCNAIIETSSNTLIVGCATTQIPNTVRKIGVGAFEGNKNLTSIHIPYGVTEIEEGAFLWCESLSYVAIPNGVTSIGGGAFTGACFSEITLPKSLTFIGSRAFAYNESLLNVYCYAEDIPRIGISINGERNTAFYDSGVEYATLHVPASAIDKYKTTAPWSSFGNIVALTEEEMGIDNPEFKNQKQGSLAEGKSNSEFIYDLNGRHVEKATKGGIYIVNGRKVVIK